MTVASELHTAALAIDSDDPLMHAVAGLLDQIALTTPPSVIESQAGAATRKALLVARAAKAVAR